MAAQWPHEHPQRFIDSPSHLAILGVVQLLSISFTVHNRVHQRMLGRRGGKGRTGRTQANGRLSWPAGDSAVVLAGVVQPASVSSQKESQSRLARGRSVRSCKAPYMSPRCASREERSNEDRTATLIATTTQPVRLIPTSCHRPIPPPKRNPHPRRCTPPNPHRGAPPRPNCLPRPAAPGTGQPRRPTSCRGPWPPLQSHPLPPHPRKDGHVLASSIRSVDGTWDGCEVQTNKLSVQC